MRTHTPLALLAVILLVPALVYALGSDHPAEPVHNDSWPDGVDGLVNSDLRVHGFFVNAEDIFFFSGDTADLNAFLEQYAAIEGAELSIVIHPGPLAVRSPWDKQPRDLSADWTLYTTPFTPDRLKPGGPEPGPFVTRVDVYLGGGVSLDGLVVPENIRVTSGGEIEAFVASHQAED